MEKCSSCSYRRKRFLVGGNAYNCTSSGNLCSIADLRLAEIYQHESGSGDPLPMNLHLSLSEAVQEGQQTALRAVNNGRIGFPSNPAEFQQTLLQLHSLIFKSTCLKFAGTFRQPGEPDVSFGTGRNQKDGAPAHEIPMRLDALYAATLRSFFNTEVDQAGLARLCGRFLEEFFMVHPFHDGNGRVARLLLRVMANSTGRYYFDVFPEDSKSRRKYTEALEYAHSHVHTHSGLTSSCSEVRDPYKLIAEWLQRYIREHELPDIDQIEELEPAWLEDSLVDPLGWDEPDRFDEPELYNDEDG